ncbi:MAG: selenium cofactor biosynthesis protein YqeC [Anaerolineales bacterium]|nr:selenium cofactor biosynthesis protein YqeC [Anaerolineales bacterium]
MLLSRALRLSPTPCLALTGAGGKTTALFKLARELPPPVIVTATTHLHVDQVKLTDSHWMGETCADFAGLEENLRGVMLVTGPIDGDRTTGLNESLLYWLHAVYGFHDLPLLVEADGARQKPLKAPAEHEPVIPDFVETVVVVAGMSGLGKPLTDEFVHRPEIFARLSGLAPGETVTPGALLRVLTHPSGGLKNIPSGARRVALLNQADTPELQAQAKALAEGLLSTVHAVVIASLQQSQIHAVHEPVAGIILAAGEAKRFGQPKQLLDWHGQPFVRVVAQTALAAGLSPLVVVTGAKAELVEAAVKDLPVIIVRNEAWQAGQSSSIRAGVRALTPTPLCPPISELRNGGMKGGQGETCGAAIFLLADQPQVTPAVLRALVERHAQDLAPILAPLVQGQRANPVLFDRVTFPDLLALSGDVGGRAIFSKHPVTYLPWLDASLLLDIDTPEEYQKSGQ